MVEDAPAPLQGKRELPTGAKRDYEEVKTAESEATAPKKVKKQPEPNIDAVSKEEGRQKDKKKSKKDQPKGLKKGPTDKKEEQKGEQNAQKEKKDEQKGRQNAQDEKKDEQKGRPKVAGTVADNYFYDAPKNVGDIWWSNFMGQAVRQISKDDRENSGPPFRKDDMVYVQFASDGTLWRVPHLIPVDLAGDALPPEPGQQQQPNPKKAAKAKAAPKPRPVEDFELPTVRAKFSFQGKNDPIVKVEAREDRNDARSRWKQKFQIVIRGSMCATSAMNICQTFCQLYQGLNLNPSVLDFKECRDALIGMKDAGHNWAEKPMDWKHVASLCLKGFPRFLG